MVEKINERRNKNDIYIFLSVFRENQINQYWQLIIDFVWSLSLEKYLKIDPFTFNLQEFHSIM